MEPFPGDSVEQQVNDKFNEAFMFAFGDEPVPEPATIADPMALQALQGAMQGAIKESLLLLAREIDSLKRSA